MDNPYSSDLDRKRAQRYVLLKHIYDVSDGDETHMFTTQEFEKKYDWDTNTCRKLVQYLEGEDLIQVQWFIGGDGLVGITHAGIVQIENAVIHPVSNTQYFPPVSQIVFVANGNITIGGHVVGRDLIQSRNEGNQTSS